VGVSGLIDHTHPALAELFEDFVMRNDAPDHGPTPFRQECGACTASILVPIQVWRWLLVTAEPHHSRDTAATEIGPRKSASRIECCIRRRQRRIRRDGRLRGPMRLSFANPRSAQWWATECG
jgi:hypothetical protein